LSSKASVGLEELSATNDKFLQALREIEDAKLGPYTFLIHTAIAYIAWQNDRRRTGAPDPICVSDLIEAMIPTRKHVD
jgi:hypothetical protein